MPLQIIDRGAHNRIDIDPDIIAQATGSITLHGSHNVISVAAPLNALGASINVHNNTRIEIGEQFNGKSLRIYAADGTEVTIGKRVTLNGLVRLLLHEPRKIIIGDHCLIASEVDFMVSDMHSIIDASTGLRINPAGSIELGDRVWIGQRCMVLKGVVIGSGSIIGAGSTVTNDVPPNCLAVGYPARVIKQGVIWAPKLI